MKVRLRPKDDYSIAEGTSARDAFEQEFDNGAGKAAALLMFTRLVEAGLLSEDDVLTILNTGHGTSWLEWEVVPAQEEFGW